MRIQAGLGLSGFWRPTLCESLKHIRKGRGRKFQLPKECPLSELGLIKENVGIIEAQAFATAIANQESVTAAVYCWEGS